MNLAALQQAAQAAQIAAAMFRTLRAIFQAQHPGVELPDDATLIATLGDNSHAGVAEADALKARLQAQLGA